MIGLHEKDLLKPAAKPICIPAETIQWLSHLKIPRQLSDAQKRRKEVYNKPYGVLR